MGRGSIWQNSWQKTMEIQEDTNWILLVIMAGTSISYDGDIIAVTDQDDHSVAISNVLSIDVRVDKHWYYKDGESIEFRDDYFQYRRAGEDELA